MSGTACPRPEHPRPGFERSEWINLNGEWSYVFDFGLSGKERGLAESKGFDGKIIVPFCPESELSGVGHKDFINGMWYHRKISIPADWTDKKVILHLAADYESEVFVDGVSAGTHFGGSVTYACDITLLVKEGSEHDLVIRIFDDTRSGNQPGGKQSQAFKSAGCRYTRVTGIWQTVWLEAAGACGLEDVQIIPNFDAGSFTLVPAYYSSKPGLKFRARLLDGDKVVAEDTIDAENGCALRLTAAEAKSWSPESPFLYGLKMEVLEGDTVVDSVKSYSGLRKVHIEDDQVYLNNKPLYQRLVLDQGFYPDGIWTAPSDEALKRDIELSMAAGFNGARLHQKVFEERFHYWADKLGYLTWGESASWGLNCSRIESARNFLTEWAEIVRRDRNRPSIITWTPLNETAGANEHLSDPKQHTRMHVDLYNLSKMLDSTRPVNDTSGYVHVKTDLWTIHNYSRPAEGGLKDQLDNPQPDGVWKNFPEQECKYTGQPYIIDEFGGLTWIPKDRKQFADNSWGYGGMLETDKEFFDLLEGEVNIILDHPKLTGYCYTQLTDVEQEENGIYNYDRTEKFDMAKVKAIFSRQPKKFD